MLRTTRHSLKISIGGFVAGVSAIAATGFDQPNAAILAAVAVGAFLFTMKHASARRPCGHGIVAKGKVFHYPYVINPCPHCGDDLNERDGWQHW